MSYVDEVLESVAVVSSLNFASDDDVAAVKAYATVGLDVTRDIDRAAVNSYAALVTIEYICIDGATIDCETIIACNTTTDIGSAGALALAVDSESVFVTFRGYIVRRERRPITEDDVHVTIAIGFEITVVGHVAVHHIPTFSEIIHRVVEYGEVRAVLCVAVLVDVSHIICPRTDTCEQHHEQHRRCPRERGCKSCFHYNYFNGFVQSLAV